MKRRNQAAALAMATVALVLVAGLALANEFAFGQHWGGNVGFKGNQLIRTNPATVIGWGFIHPAQVHIDGNGTFIGIGTYKGRGTVAGNTSDCPNQYSPSDWSGYYDYEINMVYNCYPFCEDCWQTNDEPSFKIDWNYCPTIGNRWVLTFDGTRRGCLYSSSHFDGVSAGLEVLPGGLTDYNIDVTWKNMENRSSGLNWSCTGNTQPGYADFDYHYEYVSNCKWHTYYEDLD